MKVLITGGFGYLGGRLSQFLAKQKDCKIFLGSRHHVQSPSWLPEVQVVRTAWDSPSELEKICVGMDVVVHLAGMNAEDCANNPRVAIEVNSEYTKILLRAAIGQKVKRFIYLSTAHVYGSPLIGKITEATPTLATHPYATSHLAGEKSVLTAHKCNEIEGVVIRLSNAFGAPAHKDVNCWMLLVNDLCRQAVTTQKMILKSSGLQRRDFITLTDACRAITHLLRLSSDKLADGLFNVGGEWSPSVWEMAQKISACCQKTLGFLPELIRSEPIGKEQSLDLEYDCKKIQKTGFYPYTHVEQEIEATLLFCSQMFQ